ncbi:MAG: NAD(P)/FAD-dependent oxidoreductase [Ignavibacteria bacterium]|nr:NAD(P)/FAD-dependent oxidoreductase [Ignavibacteria bacterium]MBI3766485.1 NAD(P)/FAD-dependent oxidoreductase [Ignavibacteriales bacterium]
MNIDALIIGGGVIGLACAAESAQRGYATLLVERHESFGQEASSRNSEVIHSGVYYPYGSLKAKLCVAANNHLYKECKKMDVWYKRCGKLIVAVTENEVTELENLYRRGRTNGVEEIELIDQGKVKKIEPHISCRAAIFLPSTGIIDSHELMKAYVHKAKAHGVDIAFQVEYLGVEPKADRYVVCLKEVRGETAKFTTRFVINAAGLFSDRVAASFGIDIDAAGYRLHPNRGHYYAISPSKSRLVSRLVYPLPHRHLVGAGIHITLDRAGQCRLGPDAEYIDATTPEANWYMFDDTRREQFYSAVVQYFPTLEREDLSPGLVGVRAKLKGSNENVRDFIINEESDKGLPGLVNLIGIESPGLTCSAEIAREVFHKLEIYK